MGFDISAFVGPVGAFISIYLYFSPIGSCMHYKPHDNITSYLKGLFDILYPAILTFLLTIPHHRPSRHGQREKTISGPGLWESEPVSGAHGLVWVTAVVHIWLSAA